MDEIKTMLVLIGIIIVGIIVVLYNYIVPYLRNKREIKEKKEIKELIKNSLEKSRF